MATYNISMEKHRSWTLSFTMKEDNVAIDLTGYEFFFALKNSLSDEKTILTRQLSLGEDTGTALISLTPSETGGLRHGDLVYDIKSISPSDIEMTLLSGKCTVKQVVGE